jgi:hypothetical protein
MLAGYNILHHAKGYTIRAYFIKNLTKDMYPNISKKLFCEDDYASIEIF